MTKAHAWMLALLCFSFLSVSVSVSVSAEAARPAWTVLIYLNGFNDLDAAGQMNLNQMESVGSSPAVNVIVEWGSLAHRKSTKRLLVQKDYDLSHVTSPVLEELGKVDMGSPATLQDFLLWGIHRFPAEHYMVVVWDHGSGWHEFIPSSVHPHDISWDDVSGHAITTEQLGQVIREVSRQIGRKIDIYSSDACLMAMGEIASEMSGAIDFFAGSEELEPEDGWPYDVILSELINRPTMSPKDLATQVASSYVQLNYGKDDATFSVFDMSRLAALEDALEQLAGEMARLNKSDRQAVLRQVKLSQTFYSDYVDLGDFIARLPSHIALDADTLREVRRALQKLIVANFKTVKYPTAQGLALWLPSDLETYKNYKKRYSELNFEKRVHWSRAIASYLH